MKISVSFSFLIFIHFNLSNFILSSLTNSWHTSRRVDPPRKSENKERAANFILPDFSSLFPPLVSESFLTLGNFNNPPMHFSRRDGVYLTVAFSPRIHKLYFAMVVHAITQCRCYCDIFIIVMLFFEESRAIQRQRVFLTSHSRLCLPACLAFASGCMSE